MSVALTDTASSTDVGDTPGASATLVFGDTVPDLPSASGTITGGDGIVIGGPRPAVEKHLERAFTPIAAPEVYPASSEVRQVPISTRTETIPGAGRPLAGGIGTSVVDRQEGDAVVVPADHRPRA